MYLWFIGSIVSKLLFTFFTYTISEYIVSFITSFFYSIFFFSTSYFYPNGISLSIDLPISQLILSILHHPPSNNNTYSMLTREKCGVFKPHSKMCLILIILPKPQSIKDALSFLEWKEWMQQEFNSLMKNGTYELVPPPKHDKIIGNMWLLRTKLLDDKTLINTSQELQPRLSTNCRYILYKYL